MSSKVHAMHGRDHGPRSADPSYTEHWHKCGDPGEPALSQDGIVWFRLAVGPPGTEQAANQKQSLEVVIAVSGGADGDALTTFPAGYCDWADGENIPAPGFDSTGAFRAYYINGTTRELVIGPLP